MHFKVLDIFLLPKAFYNRIKDGKFTLLLGILLVGFINTLFSLNILGSLVGDYDVKLIYNFLNWPLKNAILVCFFIVFFGVVDVFFFSKPIFDIFRSLKKTDNSISSEGMLNKVMKIYIIAHLSTLAYLAIAAVTIQFPQITRNAVWTNFFVFFEMTLVSLWFTGIISRGLNVIYKMQPIFKFLTFIGIYLWSTLEGHAVSFVFGIIVNKFMK